MLWFEHFTRPSHARLELDAKKIANLPVNAVFNVSHQMSLRVANAHDRFKRNRLVELEARA